MQSEATYRRQLVSRACDLCRSRKVKCSGTQPCQQCGVAAENCTYLTVRRMRGPPKGQSLQAAVVSSERLRRNSTTGSSGPRSRPRVAISSLSLVITLYGTRMFSVWPIVDADDLISRLHADADPNVYALALAVAAATLEQLKPVKSLPGQCPSAEICESECQRTCHLLQSQGRHEAANLDWLRTAFFLHAYHESRASGSAISLLSLREAMSLAQLMGLHNDATYQQPPTAESQLLRRIFWLLFVTERGIAIFHNFPVMLSATLPLPPEDTIFQPGCFQAFETVVRIFTAIDQSGLCNPLTRFVPVYDEHLVQLQVLEDQLRALSSFQRGTDDIQRANICVTSCWARILLWKTLDRGLLRLVATNDRLMSSSYILEAAEEMIVSLSDLNAKTFQSHGGDIRQKIFEVASSLIQYLDDVDAIPALSIPASEERMVKAVKTLNRMLASMQGGNEVLLNKLFERLADVHRSNQMTSRSLQGLDDLEHLLQPWDDDFRYTTIIDWEMLNPGF